MLPYSDLSNDDSLAAYGQQNSGADMSEFDDAGEASGTALSAGEGEAVSGGLMASLGTVFPIIGAGLQIGAAVTQAENIRNAAQIANQIAGMNEQYEELDAYKATTAGVSEAARYQGVINQTLGEQQGEEAAHNVNVGYGTAAVSAEDLQTAGFMNQQDIKNQAYQKSLGYQSQYINTGLQAALGTQQANLQAGVAIGEGEFGAVKSLASGYTPTRVYGGLPGVNDYGGGS